MKEFDWSRPQRQPAAGLAVAFLNTIWEVAKRIWPLAIVMVLGKEGKVNKYEIIGLIVFVFTIFAAVMQFLYFRFYLEGDRLIIKKGWLNKETQVIPLEKIQTVNIEQGLLHQLLNIVKLSIDTAGSQKTEGTIDALHKGMAESLREKLLAGASQPSADTTEARPLQAETPILRLGFKDLLKLSISANHLEAFFILLSFVFGLYDSLKDIDDRLFSGLGGVVPQGSLYALLFLAVLVLVITMLVSTARIFLRFYHFNIVRNEKGYRIKSGLTNVRERLVSLQKIQLVSWHANWIRKLMGLWMLEFHVAGGDVLKNNLKAQVPLTQSSYIDVLAGSYHPIPDEGGVEVRMHPAFIARRTLMAGLLPAVVLAAGLWWLIQLYVLLFLLYTLVIFITSWCAQRKFRLWAMEDVLYIKKGIFGEERTMMQWHKLQSVSLRQSIYQRSKGLATLLLHTAGGTITINYIDVEAARQIANYVLYQTEVDRRGWM